MVPVIYTDHVPAAFSAINKLVVVTQTRAVENVPTIFSKCYLATDHGQMVLWSYIFLNYTKIGTYTYAMAVMYCQEHGY